VNIFGKISSGLEKWIDVAYFFVLGSVTLVFIFYGYRYFINWGLVQHSDITGMNLGWIYIAIPFSGISWLIFLVEDFYTTYFLDMVFSKRQGKGK